MNQKRLLNRDAKYEKYGHSKYEQILTLFEKYIQKDPSLIEKVCIICFKDKDYKEIVNIDKISYKERKIKKDEYLKELDHYINQVNFAKLKPFLIQDKCPHFYHKYCSNFSNYIHLYLNASRDNKEKCILCQ